MGFLKRLFGSGSVKTAPTPDRSFLPRADRVRLVALHRVWFRPQDTTLGARLELANISASGVGLMRQPGQSWPEPGGTVSGELEIENISYPCTMKVVRLTPSIAGGTWENVDAAFQQLIKRYFEAELAAVKLFDVDPRFLREPPVEGKPRWIQGDNNCELFFVRREDAIPYFNLLFLGNYVEGGEGKRTRFGSLRELNREKPTVSASEAVEWSERVSDDLRESVLKFLTNVPGLHESEAAVLARLIKST